MNRQHQNVNAPQVCRVVCLVKSISLVPNWPRQNTNSHNRHSDVCVVRVSCQLATCVHYDVKHHVVWQLMKWLHTINTTKCQDISRLYVRGFVRLISSTSKPIEFCVARAYDKCFCLICHLNGVKNLFVAPLDAVRKATKKLLKNETTANSLYFECAHFRWSR